MRIRDWFGRQTTYGRDLEWLRAVHARMDEAVPDGATLFLGDSITYGLVASAVAPLPVKFGIGGQTSFQLLESMDNYRSMKRARAVCILIGTNDLLEGRFEGLGERYKKILAKVPVGIPVLLNSIPPIARLPDLSQRASMLAKVACDADQRCRFVDLHSALAGVSGAFTSDGVHLDVKGYAVWIHLLRQEMA